MLCTVYFGSRLGSGGIFLLGITGISVHFISRPQTHSQRELRNRIRFTIVLSAAQGLLAPWWYLFKLNLRHGQKSAMTSVSITFHLIKYGRPKTKREKQCKCNKKWQTVLWWAASLTGFQCFLSLGLSWVSLSLFIEHWVSLLCIQSFLSMLLLLSKASLTHSKSDKRGKKRHNYLNIKFNSSCHSAQWLDCEI